MIHKNLLPLKVIDFFYKKRYKFYMPPTKKKLLLLPNPEFDRKKINAISKLYQIFCVKYGFELDIINLEFLNQHVPSQIYPQILVIAGGDGTIHKAINAIPESYLDKYLIGIIPAGTANEIAKLFSIPLNIEKAAELIANPTVISKFHLGQLTGSKNNENIKFATGILYGMPDYALRITPKLLKYYFGNIAFNYGVLRSFYKLITLNKRYETELIINNKKIKTSYLLINNASLTSKNLKANDLNENDGKFFSMIYLNEKIPFLKMFELLFKNQIRFNILKDKEIYYSREKEFEIEYDKKINILIDGEEYSLPDKIKIARFERAIFILSL